MSEKGIILPSVLVFLSGLIVLIIGTAVLVTNQTQLLAATQDSYEARSMAGLAQKAFEEKAENQPISEMTVLFDEGTVHIQQMNESNYKMKATLKNGYTYDKRFYIETEEAEVDSSQDSSAATDSSEEKDSSHLTETNDPQTE